MTEGSIRSYDPFAYYVNKVKDLDEDVVQAYRYKGSERETKKWELLAIGDKAQYNVFICINTQWHGFVLLVPSNPIPDDPLFEGLIQDQDNPYKIESRLLCHVCELRYDNQDLRMYKISKKMQLFKDIEKYIKKSFFIGRYKDVPIKALDFAALSAAPHHYASLLSDCVSFAMAFCDALLSYCSNGLEIDETVQENIKKASASGFSVERMSRQNFLSGFVGNFSLGGVDVSSYLGSRHGFAVVVLLVVILLLWPVLAAFAVYHYMNNK